MRFKLDENFGGRTQRVFRAQGHEVHTVKEESLGGASDADLFSACCREARCLVTLDRDFADVTRYSPRDAHGIVVIRISRNPSLALLERMIEQLLERLQDNPIAGELWIVEPGRIRIHQRAFGDDNDATAGADE